MQDSSEAGGDVERILGIASNWRERLSSEGEALGALRELIKQVQLTESGLRVTIDLPIVLVDTGPSEFFRCRISSQ